MHLISCYIKNKGDLYILIMINHMSTSKSVKAPKNQSVTKPAKNEAVNTNANYYREKARAFYVTASYSAPSEPIAISMNKREKKAQTKAGLEAASKVRHNKPAAVAQPPKSFVVIAGVPHKLRDGQLVPMIPAAESKKWDIIEVKPAKKGKK